MINDNESFDINDILLILLCLFPISNWLVTLGLFLSSDLNEDSFKSYLNKLNNVRRCDQCKISSRVWQLDVTDSNNMKCPHCDSKVYASNICDASKNYPFAPKISTLKAVKRKRSIDNLMDIKESYQNLEMYDNELEAYEKLQMKKLEELEQKANEIKAELGMK